LQFLLIKIIINFLIHWPWLLISYRTDTIMSLALIADFELTLTIVALQLNRVVDCVFVKLSIYIVSSFHGAQMVLVSLNIQIDISGHNAWTG
jgi:hypothetical protein